MLNFKTFLDLNDIDLDKFKTAVKANKNQSCLAEDDCVNWVIASMDWVEAEVEGFGTFMMWNELDDEWKCLHANAERLNKEITWGFEEIF